MTEKKNAIYTIIILFSVITFLGIMDFVYDWGNLDTFLYSSDHFVGKDKWTSVKKNIDILFGKREFNDMYMSNDGFLIVRHDPEYVDEEKLSEKLHELTEWANLHNASVMLLPTADNCLKDSMPFSAPYFDEEVIYKQLKDDLPERNYVGVLDILKEHYLEDIFESGADKLTEAGEYYAYIAWVVAENRYPMYDYGKIESADNNLENDYYRIQEKSAGYKYFVSQRKNGTELIIIGDENAENFVPMFARHYEKIYVLNFGIYDKDVKSFLSQHDDISTDIVFISSCTALLNN